MKNWGLLMILITTTFGLTQSSDLSGNWEGSIAIPESELEIVVRFDSALEGNIDIPEQNIETNPLTNVTVEGNQVSFAIAARGEPSFSGTLHGDVLSGTFSQGGSEVPFRLERTGDYEASSVDTFSWSDSITNRDIIFTFADGWEAEGMLSYPAEGEGPFPTIILYHGSGSNDMDQTIPGQPGQSKVFRQLSAHLADKGFAVVRYNKRGVIGIGPKLAAEQPEEGYLMSQYIKDATDVLQQTQTLPEVDPENIVLLGHSEGTLTASSTARSDAGEDIAGLALLGVMGLGIKELSRYQTMNNQVLPYINSLDADADGNLSTAEVTAALSKAPQAEADIFERFLGIKKDADSYVFETSDENQDGRLAIEAEAVPHAQSVFEAAFPDNLESLGLQRDKAAWFEELQDIGSVTDILPGFEKPVLMMNGENDIQTLVEGAREAFAAVEAAGNTQATLITYPGLGHSFYPATGKDQPLGPMEEKPLQDLEAWLSKTFVTQ